MKKSLAAGALALGMLAMTASPALAQSDMGTRASCLAPAGVIVRADTGRGVGQHLQAVLTKGRVATGGAPFDGMTFGGFVTSGWLAAIYCTE